MLIRGRRSIAGATLVGALLAWNVAGQEYEHAKKTDPGHLCARVDRNFPQTLEGFRQLGVLLREKVGPDLDYCPTGTCEIRDLKFPGLELSILVKKREKAATVLTLTVSDPKWTILKPVEIGAKLRVVESYFGVKAEPGGTILKIIGDCTPVDVHHRKGRVTRLKLDCQACI